MPLLGYSLMTVLHKLLFNFEYIYINLIKTLRVYWPSS